MCQFPLFETLALIDGKFHRLPFHQQRVNTAFADYFRCNHPLNLADIAIPTAFQQGFFRCRIDYNAEQYSVNFYPYSPKKMSQFQLVYTENLDYRFKYSDRKRLDLLKKSTIDEVIIINNGFVSDCTIGNLLFLKNNRWYSPKNYLLKGTQLSYLLAEDYIELIEIRAEDIFYFEKIMVINALNPFSLDRAVPITSHSVLR